MLAPDPDGSDIALCLFSAVNQRGPTYILVMVTISITEEAFAAIRVALSGQAGAEADTHPTVRLGFISV
jgi:hypothetical protein